MNDITFTIFLPITIITGLIVLSILGIRLYIKPTIEFDIIPRFSKMNDIFNPKIFLGYKMKWLIIEICYRNNN